MGYNDRSTQKCKKSGKHDDECEELSTFSNLKLKKGKHEVDDGRSSKKTKIFHGNGRSTKKTKSFDWDDNIFTSTSQDSQRQSKSQKRSMPLGAHDDNLYAVKKAARSSGSVMKHNIFGDKLSIFGDNIQEPIFKQTETFRKPPMKLISDDSDLDTGEDTSPYGDVDDDDFLGTDEENALLQDDSEHMENKENDNKSRTQKEKQVQPLTINEDLQQSGQVVTSPDEQVQKSGNKITKEVEEKKIPDENDMTQFRSEEGTKQHNTNTCSSSSNCSTCITSSSSSGSSAPIGNYQPSEDSESDPSEYTESDNDDIK